MVFQATMKKWKEQKKPVREKPKLKSYGVEKLLDKPKQPGFEDDASVRAEGSVEGGGGDDVVSCSRGEVRVRVESEKEDVGSEQSGSEEDDDDESTEEEGADSSSDDDPQAAMDVDGR